MIGKCMKKPDSIDPSKLLCVTAKFANMPMILPRIAAGSLIGNENSVMIFNVLTGILWSFDGNGR